MPATTTTRCDPHTGGQARVHVLQSGNYIQQGAHRIVGVSLALNRHTEQGHDRVTVVFIHDSLMRLDDIADGAEHLVQSL